MRLVFVLELHGRNRFSLLWVTLYVSRGVNRMRDRQLKAFISQQVTGRIPLVFSRLVQGRLWLACLVYSYKHEVSDFSVLWMIWLLTVLNIWLNKTRFSIELNLRLMFGERVRSGQFNSLDGLHTPALLLDLQGRLGRTLCFTIIIFVFHLSFYELNKYLNL